MTHKLTKSFVDSLPLTSSGQILYRDSELKGFGLRIGTTSKVYFSESKVNGKVVRISIGKHGVFTAEQARIQAREFLLMMAKGINPLDKKRADRVKSVTLEQVLNDLLEARKTLKPRTVHDYRYCVGRYLSDWMKKPMLEITKDMVAKRHTKIGEISPAQANQTMRYLRALFNFAAGQYENSKGEPLIPHNPVKRISQTRAWYRLERRKTVIKGYELAPWYSGVMSIQNHSKGKNTETIRDYLLLVLFTGLRKEEAACLTWANVDLRDKTLTIPDTKNHQAHVLPLSDFLFDLLDQRRPHAVNEYVFPNVTGTGRITEQRKQMEKITRQTGISFTIHDLRRTFITVAESLDISAYALKRLLNHKMNNDITAGYIITDVERLRAPMQKITDQLLRYMGVKPSAEIVKLPAPHSHQQPVVNSIA